MNTFLFIVPPLHLFGVGVGSNLHLGSQFFQRDGDVLFVLQNERPTCRTCFFSISAPGHREQHLRRAPAHAVNVAFASWTWLAWSDMEHALWEATGLLGEAANVLMVQMVLGCLGHPDAIESGWLNHPSQNSPDRISWWTIPIYYRYNMKDAT